MARVLIVDDEQSIRTSIGLFAEQAGHQVSLASNAAEALSLLRKEPFDVVVTDIILPRKTGVVLLGEIREVHPDLPVIMITGEPEVGTAAEAVKKGAFDYLSKPISKEDITRTVAAAAEKKALLDKNRQLGEENRRQREHLAELVEERTGQLQDSEARYRSLFANIADPIFVFDKETNHFVDCNQSALDRYEYTLEELRTMTPLNLHLSKARDNASMNIADTETPPPNQYMHVTKSGEEFPVEVHTNPLLYGGKEAWISSMRDITVRKQAEEQTKRLLDQQTCINELSIELGNVSDIDRIYESIYRHVRALMDAKSFIISFYDAEEQLLHAAYAQLNGEPFDVSKLPPIPLEEKGRGAQSEVIHTGEPLYLPNFRKAREKGTTEYTVDNDGAVGEGAPPDGADDIARSALFVPLKLEGKTIGVMQVQSYRVDAYRQEDIDLLAGLANVAAIAVWNAQLGEKSEADAKVLQATLDGIIKALAATTETRDPYTAGHQQRVTELAVALAEEMCISDHQKAGIRVASLLHDIGKMSIPAEILSKPTKLKEMEFALIKNHSAVAYDILKVIDFPWPVAEIVLQHHERLDGSGYPNGLKSDEILLEARIIAVADVVEAMSSHRPYRAALGLEAALNEISKNKDSKYDPDVVDACLRVFDAGFSFSDGAA